MLLPSIGSDERDERKNRDGMEAHPSSAGPPPEVFPSLGADGRTAIADAPQSA